MSTSLPAAGADVASHFWRIAAARLLMRTTRSGKGALFDVRRQTARAVIIDGDDRALRLPTVGGKPGF